MYELSDQLRDFKPSDDLWNGDLLKPTDDEISVVLKFYSGIYFKWGYPSKEFSKKSLSFLAIVDICERYDDGWNETNVVIKAWWVFFSFLR